jgi:hypothetical protein
LGVWVILAGKSVYSIDHEYVMGDNGEGGYWLAEKNPVPEASGFDRVMGCRAVKNFDFNYVSIKPTDLPPGCKIVRHIITIPSVDKAVREEAKRRCEDSGYESTYAGWSNCRGYANSIADYAEDLMDQIPPYTPPFQLSPREWKNVFYGF